MLLDWKGKRIFTLLMNDDKTSVKSKRRLLPNGRCEKRLCSTNGRKIFQALAVMLGIFLWLD